LQVEAHLMAEHRAGTDPGAVALFDALGEDAFHQIEILAHGFASADSAGEFSVKCAAGEGRARVHKGALD